MKDKCEVCGKRAELWHNDELGLAVCSQCDAEAKKPKRLWKASEIRMKIDADQRWLERAILAIYKRQTTDEKRDEDAKHLNAMGFSASDAHYLSYCAKWLLKGNHLTRHHIDKARERMRKYVKQLVLVANGGN